MKGKTVASFEKILDGTVIVGAIGMLGYFVWSFLQEFEGPDDTQ